MAWEPNDIAPLSLGDEFAAPATAQTEQHWGPALSAWPAPPPPIYSITERSVYPVAEDLNEPHAWIASDPLLLLHEVLDEEVADDADFISTGYADPSLSFIPFVRADGIVRWSDYVTFSGTFTTYEVAADLSDVPQAAWAAGDVWLYVQDYNMAGAVGFQLQPTTAPTLPANSKVIIRGKAIGYELDADAWISMLRVELAVPAPAIVASSATLSGTGRLVFDDTASNIVASSATMSGTGRLVFGDIASNITASSATLSGTGREVFRQGYGPAQLPTSDESNVGWTREPVGGSFASALDEPVANDATDYVWMSDPDSQIGLWVLEADGTFITVAEPGNVPISEEGTWENVSFFVPEAAFSGFDVSAGFVLQLLEANESQLFGIRFDALPTGGGWWVDVRAAHDAVLVRTKVSRVAVRAVRAPLIGSSAILAGSGRLVFDDMASNIVASSATLAGTAKEVFRGSGAVVAASATLAGAAREVFTGQSFSTSRPVADGAIGTSAAWWEPDVNRYAQVDEVVANDATDYLTGTTTYGVSRINTWLQLRVPSLGLASIFSRVLVDAPAVFGGAEVWQDGIGWVPAAFMASIPEAAWTSGDVEVWVWSEYDAVALKLPAQPQPVAGHAMLHVRQAYDDDGGYQLVTQVYVKTQVVAAELVASSGVLAGDAVLKFTSNSTSISRPSGDNGTDGWTVVGAATHYESVDDVVANDGTDYTHSLTSSYAFVSLGSFAPEGYSLDTVALVPDQWQDVSVTLDPAYIASIAASTWESGTVGLFAFGSDFNSPAIGLSLPAQPQPPAGPATVHARVFHDSVNLQVRISQIYLVTRAPERIIAELAVLSGTGTSGTVGTGAIVAESATVSGTGTVGGTGTTGTGAIVAESAVLAGAARLVFDDTLSNIEGSSAVVSGSGRQVFSASAEITAEPASLSGAGTVQDQTAQAPGRRSWGGAGGTGMRWPSYRFKQQVVQGSGQLTGQSGGMSGTGHVLNPTTAYGVLIATPGNLAGEGAILFQGEAHLIAAGSVLTGEGSLWFTGQGQLVATSAELKGEGDVEDLDALILAVLDANDDLDIILALSD